MCEDDSYTSLTYIISVQLFRRLVMNWLLVCLIVLMPSTPRAQDVSQIYVAYPPGGLGDILARHVSKYIGPLQVVNIPGPLNQQAAKTAFRNNQLMSVETSSLAITPEIYGREKSYDMYDNFQRAIILGSSPMVLVVNADLPINNVAEFKRYNADNNVDVTYATAGSITIVAALEFLELAKIKARPIPYKGGADAIQAVMGGHVTFHFGNLTGAITQTRVKIIAVGTQNRVDQLPEVMTVKEQLGKTLTTKGYFGVGLPNGINSDMANVWANRFKLLCGSNQFAADMSKYGFTVECLNGAAYHTTITNQQKFYRDMITKYGLQR